jgi:hypothetical protein
MIGPFSAADLLAFRARTGVTPPTLKDILREFGELSIGTAMFIHGLEAWNFDPEELEGSDMPQERLDALLDGAVPSSDDIEMWRQEVRRSIADSGEGSWNPALLCSVTGDDGITIYAVALQQDGGSWDALFGPFASADEALADLRMRGDVSEVSWPDELGGSGRSPSH